MKLRKTTAVLLLAAALTSALSACGETTTAPSADTQKAGENNTEPVTEAVTEARAAADVPEKDYGGHNFVFYITGNTENNWKKNDFIAEAETGEALNDARFQRNVTIEDRFNVKISTYEDYNGNSNNGKGPGYQAISKAVMAGDMSYDACMISSYDCATLAYSGYLYDLNTMPYLDLSKPWWDQKINRDLTIAGKLYYTTGDISTADNDATCAILFNKSIVNEHDMESPYELVRNGTWTIDRFAAMCTDIAADLDGDSKFTDQDRFGAIIWDDTMMGIVNACGTKCCTVNDKGVVELTLSNERTTTMFSKFADTFFDKSVSYAYQRTSYDITTPVNMFSNDQALFFMQLLDLVTYFRDMKTDFGILPFPKLDDAQEEYFETIGSWHSVFLCAPTAQEDAERTGIILESMAAESLNFVTPAYYEKTLVGKYVRDDESSEMLDIILSSRVYDLGWFYQVGGYNERIMDLWRQYKTDFVSMFEKYKAKSEKDLTKINDSFAALE